VTAAGGQAGVVVLDLVVVRGHYLGCDQVGRLQVGVGSVLAVPFGGSRPA
jgi:hypothetical protein